MATLRTRVIAAMRQSGKEWISARETAEISGDNTNDVSKAIHSMVREGFCESKALAGGHGSKRQFKLLKRAPPPRGTIADFIRANPGLTTKEIADGIPCSVPSVSEYISNAVQTGVVIRSGKKGSYTYASANKDQATFGCANQLTALFNLCLKNVRT